MSERGAIAAVGMFDGVHRGHQFMLSSLVEAGRQRGLEPVALTFSRHPIASLRPGAEPRRLTSNARRADLLRRYGAERVLEMNFDSVREMKAAQFLRVLENLDVRTLLMGFNNHIGSDRLAIGRVAAEGIIEVIGARPGEELSRVSSTAVRSALDQGDIAEAADMLGRVFSFRGKVVDGHHLGRTLGFPTANIEPEEPCQQLPADGVYAVDVRIDGEDSFRRGMANIGLRPTVESGTARRTIEINIFDFDGDLYGRTLEVAFLERLRDERRFGSVGELAEALAADRLAARSVVSPLNL